MPGPYLMGIDAGITVVKAVIFDLKGNEIAVFGHKLPRETPALGWMERDVDVLWNYVKKAIKDVLNKSKIKPEEIAAIGPSGHGDGIYLLDKGGRPVRKGILSPDNRAISVTEKWKKENMMDKIFSITGQKPIAGTPVALLRWLKENEADNYGKARWVVFCKDVIKHKLTGVVCTDETDASATLTDVKKRTYSYELLELLDMKESWDKLPEIVPGWKICGELTAQAAKETGLRKGTPVASGLHDIDAVALGSGCLEHGQLMMIIGTWSINEVIIDRPTLDPEKMWACRNYGAPNLWLVIEGSPTSAINLDWFVDQCCGDERAEARKRGISPYALCDEEIQDVPIGSGGVIFHPFLFGLPTKPTARAGFYGVAGWHTRKHLLRALYEGVALCHYDHVKDFFEKGIKVVDARLAGGGARSKPWSQMFADIIGIPIKVPSGTELGARGVAMSAGIGVGLYKDHKTAVEEAVSITREHKPVKENVEKYRILYGAYKRTIDAMSQAWDYMFYTTEKLG